MLYWLKMKRKMPVRQARFTGVRTSGNHHFHPFAQQTTLTSFGAYRVEIGNYVIELGFNFADVYKRQICNCASLALRSAAMRGKPTRYISIPAG